MTTNENKDSSKAKPVQPTPEQGEKVRAALLEGQKLAKRAAATKAITEADLSRPLSNIR